MYIEEDNIITSFITINNLEEAFTEVLEDFQNSLLDELNQFELEVNINNIFSTSLSMTIKGDEEDILEAIGIVIKSLICHNIYSFNFIFHTVEECV